MDHIANSPLLSKIPVVGQYIQGPAQNISVGIQSRNALNPQNVLTNRAVENFPRNRLLLTPAAFMGTNDDR
jgi:hypothetical protein